MQQIIGEFCEAVNATRHLRKNGHAEARYPWKKRRNRDVVMVAGPAPLHPAPPFEPAGASWPWSQLVADFDGHGGKDEVRAAGWPDPPPPRQTAAPGGQVAWPDPPAAGTVTR